MSVVNSIFSFFQSFRASARMVDGGELNTLVNLLFSSAPSPGITALAGGGAAGAPVLQYAVNLLSTVATAADSAVLPQALAGRCCVVDNEGAQSATIYAATTNPSTGVADSVVDTNSLVLAASVAVASGYAAIFYCVKDGVWKKLVSA
jgi:hypothetical protein